MRRRESGRALGKWLLLIVAIVALFGFFHWKSTYGVTGNVKPINFNTHDCIAFVRQDAAGKQDLYAVNADTGELSRLTADGFGKRGPQWSPDGKQLAYVAEGRGELSGTFQVYKLGADRPVRLTYGSTAKDDPRWSPDGQQIAYLSGGVIRCVRSNGEEAPQIYPPPRRGGAPGSNSNQSDAQNADASALMSPPIQLYKWSRDGRYIGAVQVFEGESAVTLGEGDWWSQANGSTPQDSPPSGIVDPEGALLLPQLSGVRPVGLETGNRVGLAWLPDDQVAVAFSTHDRGHGIIIRRADDPNYPPKVILAAFGYTVAPENPVVSPDGRSIAFEVLRLDSPEDSQIIGIAVLPLDAPGPVVIRTQADVAKLHLIVKGAVRDPQWSADNKRLVYSAGSASGTRDLWVVNADGSSPRNLTRGQGDNSDAVWSPAR